LILITISGEMAVNPVLKRWLSRVDGFTGFIGKISIRCG